MSLEIYGLILLGGLFIFICIGFPISFTLITLGMVFGYIGLGNKVFYLMTLTFFDTMTDTVLAAVALFTFMGYILEKAGLMERLFRALLLLSGRLKGSLYMGTIFSATLFAAATGIVGAAVTIIGLMAAPVMQKSNYDPALSAGAITAGGTLGILIPPSIMLVVMGPVMQVSVARLFAAAVLPGLMLASMYVIYTMIRVMINPELGPPLTDEELDVSTGYKMREFFFGAPAAGSPCLGNAGQHHNGTCHTNGRRGPRMPWCLDSDSAEWETDLQSREGFRLPHGRNHEYGDDPSCRFDIHGSGFFLNGDSDLHRPNFAFLELAQLGFFDRDSDSLFYLGLAPGVGSNCGGHCSYFSSGYHGNEYKYDMVLHAVSRRAADLLALSSGGFISLLYQGNHA